MKISALNLPPPIQNITGVKNLKILLVEFDEKMNFILHVENIICSAANQIYPIKILKSKGLFAQSLWDVTQSKIKSSLIYASPAWSGFISAESRLRIEALLKKMKRLGFVPEGFKTFDELCDETDAQLFEKIANQMDIKMNFFTRMLYKKYVLVLVLFYLNFLYFLFFGIQLYSTFNHYCNRVCV